jgi:signal transduction histidine kinase
LTQAAVVAQYVTTAAFVALGVAIGYRWYRQPGRAQGMLAVAIILLGLVSAAGRLQDPNNPNDLIALFSTIGFLASGYFVLLFRNELIPLSRRAMWAAGALLAVSVAVSIAEVFWLRGDVGGWMEIALLELIGAWAIFTGEPIVRFWLASNRLPAVQRARMRFLGGGFAVLIGILFIAVLGGSALQSPTAVLVTQLLALAVVPAIYVSFAPPSILRRIWRMSEENEVRAALQDLLIFSPSRQVLAERAVYWAVRLMGATAGFVTSADGKLLAATGMDEASAEALMAQQSDRPDGRVISAPLHLSDGQGTLAIVAGRFTPVFGTDEIAQLRGYANSVSAGLARAAVTERMAALESGKTQFLNLASHELRGPVTVIRGYLSMLESGMLGQLNERGRKAAAVMSSKVTEMNELIEEMMEAARLEDGALSLRLSECDLRDVARSAADGAATLLDGGHRIELDLPDRRVRVNVDEDRTRTIISNLLSNAIKYSPAGGTVTCQVRSSAGAARVAIIDEGLGIAPEHMSVLFTRFGRVITPETEHLKGTGLGLFLGRQLARLQGGDITVHSTPGKGSTFTLHLPTVAVAGGSANGSASETATSERAGATTD